jgi:hypothetical protein
MPLPKVCQIHFRDSSTSPSLIRMNKFDSNDGARLRLAERAELFQPNISRKVALLIPFKAQIRKLRGRKASYDFIRLILMEEKINVSLSTLYRFCRDMLREKSCSTARSRKPESNDQARQNLPRTAEIVRTSHYQRENYPGPWSRTKRGPRIANSKTL